MPVTTAKSGAAQGALYFSLPNLAPGVVYLANPPFMNLRKAKPEPPDYSDEELIRLEQALPKILAHARLRFGNVSGFTYEDVVQAAYFSVISGYRSRRWNAVKYPDPSYWLCIVVGWVGIEMIKKHGNMELLTEKHEQLTASDSGRNVVDDEIEMMIEALEDQIMEQIPDWKRIRCYEKEQERLAGQRPRAMHTAKALGMSVNRYYYVWNKCVKPAWKAGMQEIKKKLG